MVDLLTKSQLHINLPRLQELHKKYGTDDSFEFTNRHKVFVVWVEGEIAAFAVLGQPHGYWWLRNCVVDKKHRGKGYQRSLIEERLRYVKERGGKRVCVSIDHKNVWSLNNAISSGFKFIPGGKKHNGHMYQKLAVEFNK
jgi:GNAT superfamily N-acetyltransferase